MYKSVKEESQFKLLMFQEQKNTASMKDILQPFSKPGNIVEDDCAGTFSVTKAYRLLHKKFIGCEVDASCATDDRSELILLPARLVLSKESKIDTKGNVLSSADK